MDRAAVTSGITLCDYTTLRLGGPANALVTGNSEEELVREVRVRDNAGEPVLLLGGGSNLVIADEGFDGTVVRIAHTGREVLGDSRGTRITGGDEVLVEVAAGEDWDEFVAWTIERGFGGLECMSGIPGKVGATPIQNVGAYGWETGQFLRSVRVYDRRTGGVVTLAPSELGLAYRTSRFKDNDSAIVLAVRFALHHDGLSQPVRYAELARALGVRAGEQVPAAVVRAAVLELRRGKGMVLDAGDHDTWSAGSFFTNPIVPDGELGAMLARITAAVGAEPPQYPADGGAKLSAAWLIERAGFSKGHAGPGGRVALSTKHTLALTNRGGASTADLLALAREVRDGVRDRFGVSLHPEPLLIGCSL